MLPPLLVLCLRVIHHSGLPSCPGIPIPISYRGNLGSSSVCMHLRGAGRVRHLGNVDVEIPSFIDNMCTDIVYWEGGCDMQKVEAIVKRIVREVADEYRLPLETDKEASEKEQEKEKCGSEVCQEAGSHFRRFPRL